MAEDTYETVLLVCPRVEIYVVPPPTGREFRTDAWGDSLAHPLFTGRLRVIGTFPSSTCDIRIESAGSVDDADGKGDGELFVSAPYVGAHAVQRAQDSSRYFLLRVVHERKVAHLGLGFGDREAAFDFQVTLADFAKHAAADLERADKRKKKKEEEETPEPARDYALKDGEVLHVPLGV